MRRMADWTRRAGPFAGMIFVAGCAGVIPEAARRGVDPDFTFAELRADPDAARDRRVVFGGEILKVTPRAQETEIEVLQYPLRGDDAPDRALRSGGRFLARWSGFLDPAPPGACSRSRAAWKESRRVRWARFGIAIR